MNLSTYFYAVFMVAIFAIGVPNNSMAMEDQDVVMREYASDNSDSEYLDSYDDCDEDMEELLLPESLTLFDMASFIAAQEAIKKYELGGYDLLAEYLRYLPQDLAVNTICSAIITKFKRHDIFTRELVARYQKMAQDGLVYFANFGLEAQISLIKQLVREAKKQENLQNLLFSIVAISDHKELLSALYMFLNDAHITDDRSEFENKLIVEIDQKLNPYIGRISNQQQLHFDDKIRQLGNRLIDCSEEDELRELFHNLPQEQKKRVISYLLCGYGCEHIDNVHRSLTLCLTLLELSPAKEFEDLLLNFLNLNALYEIFVSHYPEMIEFFTTNEVENQKFLDYLSTQDPLVLLYSLIRDRMSPVANDAVYNVFISGKNSCLPVIKKTFDRLPTCSLIVALQLLLYRDPKQISQSGQEQYRYLTYVLQLFIPYLISNTEEAAHTLYDSVYRFCYRASIPDPIVVIFEKQLSACLDNKAVLAEILVKIKELFDRDSYRLEAAKQNE